MPVYVHKNGQQLGPFEENIVISSIRAGQFSGSDLGIRQGDSDWQPLSEMFPEARSERQTGFVERPAVELTPDAANASNIPVEPVAASYRKTTLQKIFFGLVFVGSLLAMIGAVVFWKVGLGPSGNLDTDLGRMALRDLMLYLAASLFLLTGLALFAFLITFKRKIIASNGLRIALRLFFILVMVVGLIDLGYSGVSYFIYKPMTSSLTANKSAGNELLKAMEEGDRVAGPLKGLAMFAPVGAGLMLFGLSGVLMTKKTGSPGS